MKNKRQNIKDKVIWILENFPDTRNSDHTLRLEYWKHYDSMMAVTNESGTWLHLQSKYTNPDLISRVRRTIQEEGNYLSDKQVAKKRKEYEGIMRLSLGGAVDEIS